MNKTITFDISSGDKGYKEALISCIKFAKENLDWKLILIKLESEKISEDLPSNIIVKNAKIIADPFASQMDILRNEDTTLFKAIQSVQNGEASGIVSAAPSGHLIALSFLKLKTINKTIKPAFAPIFCDFNGTPRIILDVGANLSFTPETLVTYAIMGAEMSKILGYSKDPKIALLNIGSEDFKGDQLHIDTFKLLSSNKNINFVGNVEADHLLFPGSNFDVAVSDAITGNIIVKSIEMIYRKFIELLKNTSKTKKGKLALLLSKKTLLNPLKQMLNEEYSGGAIVLGLNFPVVKSHGSANNREYLNSLYVCKKSIEFNLVKNLKEKLDN